VVKSFHVRRNDGWYLTKTGNRVYQHYRRYAVFVGTLFEEVHMGHHKKIERKKELDRQRRRRKKRLKVKAKAARVKKHA
jgi:hypothetical protein